MEDHHTQLLQALTGSLSNLSLQLQDGSELEVHRDVVALAFPRVIGEAVAPGLRDKS